MKFGQTITLPADVPAGGSYDAATIPMGSPTEGFWCNARQTQPWGTSALDGVTVEAVNPEPTHPPGVKLRLRFANGAPAGATVVIIDEQ